MAAAAVTVVDSMAEGCMPSMVVAAGMAEEVGTVVECTSAASIIVGASHISIIAVSSTAATTRPTIPTIRTAGSSTLITVRAGSAAIATGTGGTTIAAGIITAVIGESH